MYESNNVLETMFLILKLIKIKEETTSSSDEGIEELIF